MPLGVTVMALDIAKGAATVLLPRACRGRTAATMAAAGAAAIVGHIYPVWLRFHGGKGVAVAAGVFGVLAPLATIAAAAVFFAVGLAHAGDLARIGRRDGDAAVGRAGWRARRRRSSSPRSARGGADPVPPSRQHPPHLAARAPSARRSAGRREAR